MKKRLIIFALFIYFIILYILPKRYNFFYPSLGIYPDNNREILLVNNLVNKRTLEDIKFFELTNFNLVNPFSLLTGENLLILRQKINNLIPIIYFFKYIINRARPNQIKKILNILPDLGSAQTPAYPAGHAFQAYYLCKILSKKYPELSDNLENLAYNCDLTRVKAGLHFPSDGEFSKYLVNLFY